MKKNVIPALTALILVFSQGLSLSSWAFSVDATILSELQFPVPDTQAEKKYLGLSGSGMFNISQINSDTILVEIFSMYCPICQAEAPKVNRLYEMIQSKPELKSKIKIIGIGTGNTPFEVDVFRKKYNVQFPLFPDDAFKIQKAASQPVRTPTFLFIDRKDGKQITVRNIHVGRIDDVEKFLNQLAGNKQ